MQESTTDQWLFQFAHAVGFLVAKSQARLETFRENLIAILWERFGTVPDDLKRRINNHPDAEALLTAIRQAIRIEEIEELSL